MAERKFIPIKELVAEWKNNPEFVAAYEACKEEFRAYRESLLQDADLIKAQETALTSVWGNDDDAEWDKV